MEGMASCLAAIMFIATPVSAAAQELEAPAGDARPPEVTLIEQPAPATDRVVVSAGITGVGQYISRGVVFSTAPSVQPYVSLRIKLPELTGGVVTDASVFVGTWNSIQNGAPGLNQRNDGPIPGWYESDVYAGAAVELDNRWTVSAAYYRYISPANSFAGYNDFEIIVGFDDSDLWDDVLPLANFTLSPALRVVQEAGQPLRDDALYIQPSITPSFNIGRDQSVLVAIPISAGFSDSFYRGVRGGTKDFGFLRTGLSLSTKPIEGADWLSINGGFDLWLLNDRVANGLDSTEVVGRLGLSVSL